MNAPTTENDYDPDDDTFQYIDPDPRKRTSTRRRPWAEKREERDDQSRARGAGTGLRRTRVERERSRCRRRPRGRPRTPAGPTDTRSAATTARDLVDDDDNDNADLLAGLDDTDGLAALGLLTPASIFIPGLDPFEAGFDLLDGADTSSTDWVSADLDSSRLRLRRPGCGRPASAGERPVAHSDDAHGAHRPGQHHHRRRARSRTGVRRGRPRAPVHRAARGSRHAALRAPRRRPDAGRQPDLAPGVSVHPRPGSRPLFAATRRGLTPCARRAAPASTRQARRRRRVPRALWIPDARRRSAGAR